ncbi:MAG: FAD-binding oxidoreductase [Betaproteobacteria bacterium]|nr:FAD-binding oxidoreductase [Betaproteobacteria bacterium]
MRTGYRSKANHAAPSFPIPEAPPPPLLHSCPVLKNAPARIAVLGAGLAGAGTALELASRGVEVTLIEQDAEPVNRASLRNEGKIHLGLIYANDATLRTACLQLEGGLTFRALLHRWTGADSETIGQSTPFFYLVAHNSLLSPAQLATHYAAVERAYHARLRESPELDYLGHRPPSLTRQLAPFEFGHFKDREAIAAVFRTEERAVDSDDLARCVRAAVRNCPRIQLLGNHDVRAVARTASGLRIEGNSPCGAWQFDAEQVVNALWEQRLAIDATVGVAPEPGWVHRLKYRLIVRLPTSLRDAPSATIVLGPYGDVVIRPNGTAYVSWYPAGLKGWTHELAPPATWQRPCRGEVGEDERHSIAQAILTGIEPWYPGISNSKPLIVDAGAIVAYGGSDVDDAKSGLHDRTRIGVSSRDGYHSLDPGKLTTAPLFARLAADRVMGRDTA